MKFYKLHITHDLPWFTTPYRGQFLRIGARKFRVLFTLGPFVILWRI